MKMRTLVLMLGLAAVISCGRLAFAEEMQDMGNDSQQSQGGGMQGKMKMNPMMMQMMHKENLVATSDGGVVVLSGPRLMKYDKDLTLVKEVELPKGKGPGRGQTDSGQGNSELPPPQS